MSGKVLLVAGGTGGHIYPALALAGELSGRIGKESIAFAADRRPLAGRVIGDLGYRLYYVSSAPLPRKKVWNICRFILRLVKGLLESVLLLRRLRPDVVVAFGAYTTVPVILAAYVLRIPVILHEQNSFPGMANRFLSRFAEKIAVSFSSTAEYFPGHKTVLTGNPVRKELFSSDRAKALKYFGLDEKKITVFIFGGSLGSLSIDLNLIGMLPYLEGYTGRVQFIHICGEQSCGKVAEEYFKNGFEARVFRYLDRMDHTYAAADIVIARAGATTIAEIAALGKPAILIPFSGATANHQELNAKPLCRSGGALYFSEELLSGEGLVMKLIPLITESSARERMQERLTELKELFTGAAGRLAELVEGYRNV